MVESLWPNLHDMDRPKTHDRHIRSKHRGRPDGEAIHKVLVAAAYGGHGRDTVGWSEHIGTTIRQGVEHTEEAAASSVNAEGSETV